LFLKGDALASIKGGTAGESLSSLVRDERLFIIT